MGFTETRRDFIKKTALLTSAVSLPHVVPPHVLGRDGESAPSETVRVGVIGVGNRARQLMDQLPAPGKLVAIADCYQQRLETAQQEKAAELAGVR